MLGPASSCSWAALVVKHRHVPHLQDCTAAVPRKRDPGIELVALTGPFIYWPGPLPSPEAALHSPVCISWTVGTLQASSRELLSWEASTSSQAALGVLGGGLFAIL